MAGVLSKFDENFNNYRKSFFEEIALTKQLPKTPETLLFAKNDSSLQFSDKRIFDVTTVTSNSSGFRLKNCSKRDTHTINRNMADSEVVKTERDSLEGNRIHSSHDIRTSSDDVRTSIGDVRTSSVDRRTSSDSIRTSSDGVRTSSHDTRINNVNTVQTDSVDSRQDTASGSNRNQVNTANTMREGSSGTTQSRELFIDRLGIVLFNPKYRLYATPDSRLKSYEKWPKEKKVSITRLIDAGFAYTGIGDSVRCFYCGGAFKNWEEDSDPWREHALYFPNCGHVRQCKGAAYIKHVCGEEDSDFETDGDEDLVIDRVKVAMKRNKGAIMAARDFCTDESLLKDGIKRLLLGKETFTGVELIKATEEIKEELERREELAITTEVECLETNDNGDSDSESSSKIELVEENRKLKDVVMCKICFERIATMIVLPCGHMATCSQCISALTSCAICRAKIKGTVRALMAV